METALKDMVETAGIDTSSWSVFWEDAPDRIYRLTVPGAEAITIWRTLRALVPQVGHWPVLLGELKEVEGLREMLDHDDGPNPAEIIRKGLVMDSQALLERWRADAAGNDPEEGGEAPHGEWPEGNTADVEESFSIPYDILTGLPKEAVILAFLLTQEAWQVPAYLGFGGWNDCPPPEEQVCILKHWQDVYGAEIVGMSGDVVEMQVTRPPTTRETALTLASEQYAYCYDIVEQGVGTIESLASTLLNGNVWFFWWD